MDEINLEDIDLEAAKATIESFQNNIVQPGSEVPTDTPTQPEQVQQPSTEGQQEYIAPGEEGFVPRPGVTGAIQDIAEGTV